MLTTSVWQKKTTCQFPFCAHHVFTKHTEFFAVHFTLAQKEWMLAQTVTVANVEALVLTHSRMAENFQYHFNKVLRIAEEFEKESHPFVIRANVQNSPGTCNAHLWELQHYEIKKLLLCSSLVCCTFRAAR